MSGYKIWVFVRLAEHRNQLRRGTTEMDIDLVLYNLNKILD